MTFTRARDLLAAAAIAAVLVNLLLRLSYGDLPTLPQPAGTTLLIFAIAEVVLGNTLRARIQQRPGSRPVQALTAAKAVVLAKASSLAGAIFAGFYAGLVGWLFLERTRAADNDIPAATAGLVASLALVGAALWLERSCRVPKRPDDDKESDTPDK